MRKNINIPNTKNFDEIYNALSKEDKIFVDNKAELYTALHEISALRKEAGITQKELSERSGIPRPTISKIENGKMNVSLGLLAQLTTALGKRVNLRFD